LTHFSHLSVNVHQYEQGFLQRHNTRSVLIRTLHDSPLHGIFADALDAARRPRDDRVLSATNAFNDSVSRTARLYDGVEQLFDVLRSRAFLIYVVSEGEENIQRQKIRALKLDTIADGFFISGGCCLSDRLLRWFWQRSLNFVNEGSQSISNEFDAIGTLYDEMLRFATKGEEMFRKVAQTVLLPPFDRADWYARVGWLSESEHVNYGQAANLLVIGDRYDKDIYPAIQAFGSVVSVRLKRGKYSRAFSNSSLRSRSFPLPTASVHSMRDAASAVTSIDFERASALSKVRCAPSAPADRLAKVDAACTVMLRSRLPDIVREAVNRLPAALRGSSE
jgi:FMN phosphatase YigB (HAD superfamily)